LLIGSKAGAFADGFVDGSSVGLAVGLAVDRVVGCVVGCEVGFAPDLVGFVRASSATEGSEGLEDCAISSSKCTVGFLDLLDRRPVDSSIIIRVNNFQF
jgi:hypothetical protein